MVKRIGIWLGIALVVLAASAVVVAWSFYAWCERASPGLRESKIVIVEPGSGIAQISAELARAGIIDDPRRFQLLIRWQRAARRLQAGEYSFEPGATPRTVLDRLAAGDVVAHQVTLIEGWTFAEALRALRAHDAIRTTPAAESDFLKGLPAGVSSPEGRIFPDTYRFARGTTDLKILQIASRRLEEAVMWSWRDRAPGLALESPDDVLILASLIEKESSVEDERPMVAAVFLNRLRIGMRLQSDPTVIYGLGAAFDGDLRRADLRRDTPYNTYTRAGLPPTPIALPGAGAIRAATRPAATDALYFVASGDGDGRHRFATTLAEHNRNVARFLEKQGLRRGEGD